MDSGLKRLAGRLGRITTGGNFIPEIDGLRFLAIGSVLLFHAWFNSRLAFGLPAPREGSFATNSFNRGALGVELFFALSGFILALPFARNLLYGAKPVILSRYYLRRVTRLEPPYIFTLMAIYFVAGILRQSVKFGFWPTFFARLFYLHGLVWQDAPSINGVTWSLEIEVQFYLLMPLFAQVFRLPAYVRRTVLLLVVLLFPFVAWKGVLLYSVFSQLALFAAGILFADLYLRQEQSGFAGAGWNDVAGVCLFGLVLCLPLTMAEVRGCLPTAILLFFALTFNGIWLRRFFSWKPVYLVGGMCYSIYLIHYPLISSFCRWLAKSHPMMSTPQVLALTIFVWLPVVVALAAVFFLLVERPCMDPNWPRNLANRFAKNRVAPHKTEGPQAPR